MAEASFDPVAAAAALNDELERKMADSQQALSSWVRKNQAASDETIRTHQQSMMQLAQEADAKQLQLSNLIVEKRRVTVEKEKENMEGNTLQKGLNGITAKCQEVETDIESLQQVQREQAAILEAKQSEIARRTEMNTSIVAELQKSLSFYRKFGLNFERLDNRKLQLTFTLIDPRDHARPFSFLLLINARDEYEVEGCSPPVAAISEMLATLNATNDFSAFVVGMRKQFQAMV